MKHFAAIGALLTGTAVAFGAFGTHALADVVSAERIGTFETGVRYQLIHGLALLTLGLSRLEPAPWLRSGGWLLLAGATLFAGSLYLLVLTGATQLGAVAPIGGALMIGGWAALAWGLARS